MGLPPPFPSGLAGQWAERRVGELGVCAVLGLLLLAVLPKVGYFKNHDPAGASANDQVRGDFL